MLLHIQRSARRGARGLALIASAMFLAPSVVSAAIPASERAALAALYSATTGTGWTNNLGWLGAPGTECTWYGVHCFGDHVSDIDLPGNNLVGSLPSLAGLTEIEYFNVSGNQLQGAIPPLTSLQRLYYADFGSNRFGGTLPSLSGMTSLSLFYAGNNQITGSIPSLGGLTGLQFFAVHSNQLTGALPSIAGMTNLIGFNVRSNRLTGSIPPLTGLPNLVNFRVYDNQLGGLVPSLAALTSLDVFRIENNLLSGALPPPPAGLDPGVSSVCPNAFTAVANAAWDAATGQVPWHANCGALPDPVYASGFD
ncbi:MAG: hypothetical protein J0L88_02600 [Xanthomonadales bacterium]|nr:hypothetical protein [Xanthomonadales bacterium]